MNTSHIKVLLVDDHPLVIAGVRQMLETASVIKVAALAASDEDAMLQLAGGFIDVSLIDISLPDENGLALLQRIRRTSPQVAVVMLSAYSEDAYAIRALRSGAHGYVGKGASLDVLLDAVRTAANGGRHFSAELNELLVKQVQSGAIRPRAALTAREFEVMLKIVAGESTSSIAAQLHRSPKTISTHRTRLYAKLHIRSTAQLTRYAMEEGLIDASSPSGSK